MSRRAWLFIWGVFLITGFLIVFAAVEEPISAEDFLALSVLIGLAVYGQSLEVKYGRDSYYPHFVPFFAALLLLPPFAFMLVVIIPHLIEWLKKRLEGDPYPWYIQPYNIATHIIAGFVAQKEFFALGGAFDEFTLQSTLGALVPTLVVYLIINHYLIGQALLLARGLSWTKSGVLEIEAVTTETFMMSIGYIAALLWMLTPWLLFLVLAPFIFFQRVFKLPQLEKQSQTDGKTGLWNTRYFEQCLKEEMARAQQHNQPLAIIMGDLDLLRNINNSYGHLAGDAVIAGIAQIIMQTVRKEDVACRFGGEEYAILLSNTDQATAAKIAERIRHSIEITPFAIIGSSTPIHATMSLGLACFPQDGTTGNALIHEADVALYQAKVQGRNRVVSTTEVPHLAHVLFEQAQEKNRQSHPTDEVPDACQLMPQSAAASARKVESVSLNHSLAAHAETAKTAPPEPSLPQTGSKFNRLSLFVGTVIAFGVIFALSALLYEPLMDPFPLIVFAIMASGAQWFQTKMYEKSAVSISMAIIVATAVVSGMLGVLIVSTVVAIVHAIHTRPLFYKVLFNWSTHLLAGLGPLAVIYYPTQYLSTSLANQYLLWWIVPVVLATMFYYLTETGLVATAIALSEGKSVIRGWREQFRWLAPHYLVMGVLGFFLAIAYINMGVLGLLVFGLPVVIMQITQKEYVERTENSVRELRRMNDELSQANHEITETKHSIEQLNEDLLLTLAKIIDARDPYVSEHAIQVGEYARSIGEEMGFDAKRMEDIYRAGLLHDIGKIGISERILHKPSRLTDTEYEEVKRHAALGANFLETCRNLRHIAPFVHHHHEWWDGTGYPDRLKGEQIPLEARILAVCDAVEAMASDRPYHAGQSLENILDEIKRCAGTQFDPAVVDAFVRVILQRKDIIVNSALSVNQAQFAPVTN